MAYIWNLSQANSERCPLLYRYESTWGSRDDNNLYATSNDLQYRSGTYACEAVITSYSIHYTKLYDIEPTKSNLYNPNIAYYLSFKEQDIPLIMINAFYEEIELPFLCLDDVQSCYLATKELISKGHNQIGLIAKMDDLQGKYRMKGYIKALEEAKLRFNPEQIFSFNTETKQTLSTNLTDFLNKNKDTLTAIVCYNDEVGLEVVHACRQLDISIPEELSIIGQDNSYIAKNSNIKSYNFV